MALTTHCERGRVHRPVHESRRLAHHLGVPPPRRFPHLPPVLSAIDVLFDHPVFFGVLVPDISLLFGRPSIPIGIYLHLSTCVLATCSASRSCAVTAGSRAWWHCCRFGSYAWFPDLSVFMKSTKRCSENSSRSLSEEVLKTAAGKHFDKLDKVRIDTTVVAVNVAHPNASPAALRAAWSLANRSGWLALRIAGAPFLDARDQIRSLHLARHACRSALLFAWCPKGKA